MRFRAAVFAKYGEPMAVEEVEAPDPGPTQVLTRLFSSGICHSQLHQLHNPQSPSPAFLGHEATGVVVAKGRGVTHVKEGDHVFLTWLPRDAKPGMAAATRGSVTWRGNKVETTVYTWAECSLMDERYVVKVDKDLATDVTAIIGCAVMTGAGAVVNTAKVKPGESVAVFGLGGVGLSAVQAAAAIGARPIIAVDLDEAKLEFARRFGATHAVNASVGDPVQAVRDLSNGGVDYAFDAIGVPITQQQILQAVRPGVGGLNEGGTAVLVGVPVQSATLDMRAMLMGAKTYRASLGGTSHPEVDFPRYVEWFRSGKLRLNELVSKRYRLEQINQACDDLSKGRIFGRSIIVY